MGEMKINKVERVVPSEPVLSNKDKLIRRLINYGIIGLLIFTPLPAASVYDWSIFVIQITVFSMMILYLFIDVKPQRSELLIRSMKWPKYAVIGLFIIIFIQIIPIPFFLVKILSPHSISLREVFSQNLSNIKFLSLSTVPFHTLREGLELLTYFLFGFLILRTVTTRRQIMRILIVIIGMGIFEALYGLIQLYSKNPRILFYEKVYSLDSVTGTFVNRNHFSGYLEMIIPLTIGLIIARIDLFSLEGMKLRKKMLRLAEKGFALNLLFSFSLIGMSVAIIFSKSRSGVFLLIFSFLLIFELIIIFFGEAHINREGIKRFIKSTFLVITAFSLYIGVGVTVERFSLDRLLDFGRISVWGNTVEIFTDFPFFGSGLGTFNAIHPAYDNIGNFLHFTYAHNDIIEYLSELGIIGFLLLSFVIIFILFKMFTIWKTRANPEIKGLGIGGFVSVILILIHSLTDFNLHIPANMLLFSTIMALTLVVVTYKKKDKQY